MKWGRGPAARVAWPLLALVISLAWCSLGIAVALDALAQHGDLQSLASVYHAAVGWLPYHTILTLLLLVSGCLGGASYAIYKLTRSPH
jgi:hypothetical protein